MVLQSWVALDIGLFLEKSLTQANGEVALEPMHIHCLWESLKSWVSKDNVFADLILVCTQSFLSFVVISFSWINCQKFEFA